MAHNILTNDHYLLKIDKDIKSICEPIIDCGVDEFMHARHFYDSSNIFLIRQSKIMQYYLNKRYKLIPAVPQEFLIKINKNKFYYMMLMDEALDRKIPVAQDLKRTFNIGNVFFLIEYFERYIDIFAFVSSSDSQNMVNYYLNNLELLEKFKYYFLEKAEKLIQKASKNKIVIPKEMQADFMLTKSSSVNNQSTLNQKMSIKRLRLRGKYQGICLTNRELQTLKYMALGCTAKEVANQLNISSRTVEYYFENVKMKFGNKRLSEIIRVIYDVLFF